MSRVKRENEDMYYVNNIVCETHRENHANGKSPKGFIPLSLSFSEKWHRMAPFYQNHLSGWLTFKCICGGDNVNIGSRLTRSKQEIFKFQAFISAKLAAKSNDSNALLMPVFKFLMLI